MKTSSPFVQRLQPAISQLIEPENLANPDLVRRTQPNSKQSSEVFLRALEPGDFRTSMAWRNNPQVTDLLVSPALFISEDMERQWHVENTRYDHRNFRLAICLQKCGSHIGNVYLLNVDYIARRADFGIFIGDIAQWGKGYGYQASRRILAFGFETLGLHRVQLDVLERNARAIRMYERLGFIKEGLLRDHAYKSGCYHNIVLMGLLRTEFKS